MLMVGVLVEVDAALRAQALAIRLAQRLQRQFLDQRVAQQRLEVGPCAAVEQRVRVFRLVLAGDDVHFLFLAVLAGLSALAGGGLVLIREEGGDVHRPIALDRLQAARAFGMHGSADTRVQNQTVDDRIERADHAHIRAFVHAHDFIADAARRGESGVDLLALPRTRGHLRHGNGPWGIFSTCHSSVFHRFLAMRFAMRSTRVTRLVQFSG